MLFFISMNEKSVCGGGQGGVGVNPKNNPNNKTTETVFGLRVNNRWEPHTHNKLKTTYRSKIEQYTQNKSYQSI